MLNIPVWVEEQNGTFTAAVLGTPGLTATAATKELAVWRLVADLTARQARGEIVMITLPPQPVARREHSPAERELMDELVAAIHRERDEEERRASPA